MHRITNRWGYVRTKTPNDTEQALRRKLPPRHWIEINDLLVAFGQRLCRPISPHCSRCPIARYCITARRHRVALTAARRTGVERRRASLAIAPRSPSSTPPTPFDDTSR